MSKKYCTAQHDKKTCLLPNCSYHYVLLRDFEELLLKLDAFCFPYQHVENLNTLFQYRLIGKIVEESQQLLEKVQRLVYFNHRSRGADGITNIAKTQLLSAKFEKHKWTSFQKSKRAQTSGSVFAERIEPVEEAKLEMEVIKTVDLFPDDCAIYTCNLLFVKKTSL